MNKTVRVRVPGTTANCGPGFDSIGLACSIYNELELSLTDDNQVIFEIEGEGKDNIPTNDKNIVYQAIQAVFTKTEIIPKGLRIKLINNIPLSRGLGSSAAAIVAGLTAANAITGNQLDKKQILDMATSIEGHPDNVAPAIFGGLTISIMENSHSARCLRFVPNNLYLIVAVPEFTLSTRKARQALPASVPLSDAIYNIGRAAMLVGAICRGENEYIKYALTDKIHQPYRSHLIPGMQDVFNAALNSGALGAVISGAGPSLIAFCSEPSDNVGQAMIKAFNSNNIVAKYIALSVDTEGAKVVKSLDI